MSTPLRPKVMMSRSAAMGLHASLRLRRCRMRLLPCAAVPGGPADAPMIPRGRSFVQTYSDDCCRWSECGAGAPVGDGAAGAPAPSELAGEELGPAQPEGPVLPVVVHHGDDEVLGAHEVRGCQPFGECGVDRLLLRG